jgi:translocation and assembly module TamB
MSETSQMPPAPDVSEENLKRPPSRRRYLRHLFWGGSGLFVLLMVGAVAVYLVASSETFENVVRKRLITQIETATGAHAEIRSFHWKLLKLEVEASGIVLHGREGQGEAPYAQAASLRLAVSILDLWSPRILLRDLELVQPQIHLIVYPDGSTNQPQPRRKTESHPVQSLFDLQAGHVEVEHGVIDYDNRSDQANDFQDRKIPFDFGANDVSLVMQYRTREKNAPESYHLETAVRDLHLWRGPSDHPEAPIVQGYIRAVVDLTRNAAYVRSLQITAHSKGSVDRQLNITGEFVDFNRPHWKTAVHGDLDLKLMEPATGYPFTPEGIAKLNLTAQGQQGEFRIDGTVHADNASYIGTGVVARGVTLDARVHADPLHLQITNVTARLKAGGQLEGDVLLDRWIAPIGGGSVVEVAAEPAKREKKGKRHEEVPQPKATAPKPQDNLLRTNGKVNAYFRNVTIDTLLDMVSTPPFQRLGLGAQLNGLSTAVWKDGDVNTLAVSANLKLDSAKLNAGEVQTIGEVDGTYLQRNGSVDLRSLELTLPASRLTAHGHLGAYPLTSPTGIEVDFQSHDLGEFDRILRDLGFSNNEKTGAAALPISLGGEAEFHGSWTGSLADPHLTGTLQATNFSAEIPTGANGEMARSIHVDAVNATGSYSAQRIAIDRGQIKHGDASINVEGTLTGTSAHAKRPGSPNFDSASLLHGNIQIAELNVDEIASLLGEKLPVSGTLSTQLTFDGPLHAANGSGWVQVERGSLYGEPLTKARAEGRITSQVLHLSSITLSNASGTVQGSGSYDLHARQFKVNAHADKLDISKVQRLQNQGAQLAGTLEFTVSGSGTVDDPLLEVRASLADLAVGGEQLGSINLVGHTANQTATYDLTSRLEAAELSAHGQTSLRGDNQTKATLNFSRLNIGDFLAMAHVNGLTGESDLEGVVNLDGPLANPQQMRGEARIKDLKANIAGVHLHSEGGAHATMGNSRISLDPLHVTGEQTDLQIRGSVSLADKRQLDLAANGTINLKLIETIDPDVTASGTTTFRLEAHGPLNNPELSGRIDFANASLALEDLPNSLSQLSGTLEFNRNRLEVKSLTAMSGGGQLSVSGYLAYTHGIYADLALKGKSIRIRYPQGVSSAADINLQLQGPQSNLLLSGNVLITRFTVSPEIDLVALGAQNSKAQAIPPANAPSNHVRLDVRVQSTPQLNFQNAYAKLAGDVDLRLRGTIASPSLLGRISITEGNAIIAGTRYELQRGEITFTNPVRIQPSLDINASARVQDYDITLGVHGTLGQMTVSYRSDPPLPEADVVALLALGRTQDQQRLYTQQQEQLAASPVTDALLGGALNATMSSRVQKIFGVGSVKVDPNYLGVLGNSTTRITVVEQLGKYLTLTYATDVDTTAQQLIQADVAINRHVSLQVTRDESGVFSMVIKATRRFK